MSSLGLIQKITRLAVQSFNRDPRIAKSSIGGNEVEQIKKLVNSITISDLNIDPALLEDRGPFNPNQGIAPVTYMQIYEDADVTICIFILKNGVKLPLHDHPDMNGILKVIHGTVSIQSYTMKCGSQYDANKLIGNRKPIPGLYSAVKHPCHKVTSSDSACFVYPDSHNLHEIKSVEGMAAFLDILSPSYGVDQRSGEERDCHYYEEVDSSLGGNLPNDCVYLMNIPTPLEFWCDQAEYKGPPVNDLDLVTNGQNDS